MKKPATRSATRKAIPMVRDADEYPAPHKAEVHPDEVENYRAGGWRILKGVS